MKKEVLRRAFRDTVPVMTGYLVLGAGFGILMHEGGYGPVWALSMSLFIYAGSMQYAGVSLLTASAPLFTVALTTLAVNARHLFYGISMAERYQKTGAEKPYLIFALTDETYSLVSSREGGKGYDLAVSLLDQSYWVAGTALGAFLGQTVNFNSKGIDFALTALFITIFTDQWLKRKNHIPAAAGVIFTVLCRVLFGPDSFLIPSMVLIAAFLLLGRSRLENDGAPEGGEAAHE